MRDAAIALVVLAVLMVGGRYLFRRSRTATPPPPHVPRDGPLVLQPPRRTAIMLGITALVPAGVLGALTLNLWRAGRTTAVGLLPGVVATLAAVAVAVYQFARAARARVVVHDLGIEEVGVARRRLVGWNSIAKMAFNPANHWFFVTVSDGSHLWLPADVPGMGDFATIALRRLPPAVLLADPVVREVLDELADAENAG